MDSVILKSLIQPACHVIDKHRFSHELIKVRVIFFEATLYQYVFVPNFNRWFVFGFYRVIEMKFICKQAEINLLFMMGYLPPGLFDRLRVRCCSLEFDYCNWKDHLLLFGDDHRFLVHKHNYPPGAESSSPAIYIKGRGPKEKLESLWEVLLRLVQVGKAVRLWLSVHICLLTNSHTLGICLVLEDIYFTCSQVYELISHSCLN